MDPEVLQRTMDSLGRVIRRPPLTERLLGKPPFRYLHDVITEVIRATGFMKGLYTESELKSDNVKDKDAKISFLQKAVDVVTIVLGEPLSVKPARVVAGHEPEKTNELLQAIGKCCLSKLSSEDAVRKVLAGERPDLKGKPPSTSKSQDKENRESKEDERKSQKDKEDRNASEIRDRSTSRERKEREHVKREERKRTEERERDGEKDALRNEEKRDGDKNRMKPAKPEKEKDKTREKEREKGREKERRSEGGRGKERDKERPKEREKKGREKDKEPERDHEPEKRRDRTKESERSERKSKSSEETTPKRTSEGPARAARTEANKELSSLPKNAKSSESKGTRRLGQHGTDGRMETKMSPYTDLDRKPRRGVQPVKSLGRKYPNKMSAAGSSVNEHIAKAPGERSEPMPSAEPRGALEAERQERADRRISDELVAKVPDKKPGDTAAAQLNKERGAVNARAGDSSSSAEGEAEKPPVTLNGEASEELPPHVTQRKIPRPNSARPAPPRVKRQGSTEVVPPERVGSGKVVPSVIVDKHKEDDDEDEQFVVEEAAPLPPEMPEMETDTALELDMDEKHGGLVKKILETKKDYETQQQLAKSTEKDKVPLSETGRRKEKDLVSKEIEKLRTSIQTLCRSALPLGKIMDYIQEDMDAMQNELQSWRSENKVHREALLREQSITDSAVEPLRIELTDLEQLIKEQQDKICAVKANILRNEEKIQKMVFSISAPSRT